MHWPCLSQHLLSDSKARKVVSTSFCELHVSSFHELMQSRVVRRPSACLETCCANRFFSSSHRQWEMAASWLNSVFPNSPFPLSLRFSSASQSTNGYMQYGLTFCLYVCSLYEAPLHSPFGISISQLDLMSKSWNELLRHWRSGCLLLSIMGQGLYET